MTNHEFLEKFNIKVYEIMGDRGGIEGVEFWHEDHLIHESMTDDIRDRTNAWVFLYIAGGIMDGIYGKEEKDFEKALLLAVYARCTADWIDILNQYSQFYVG